MANTPEQASQQVKRSWTRAYKLAELTGVKPVVARSFLKHNKHCNELLDQKTIDKRSPKIRDMLKACQHTQLILMGKKAETNKRASKGDTTQTPRAGAPNPILPEISLENIINTLQTWKNNHDKIVTQLQNCIESLQNQQKISTEE